MILTDFIHQRIRGMTEPAVNPATSLSITTDVKLIPQDERATTVTQRANYTGGSAHQSAPECENAAIFHVIKREFT